MMLSVALAPSALSAQSVDDANEQAAVASAEAWLRYADTGMYQEGWSAAASLFRDAVTAEQWEAAARQVLAQTGTIVSRALREATYSTSLPQAPAGEYVVIEYRSAFQLAPAAVETVVMRKEGDAEWKAIGYTVRPE